MAQERPLVAGIETGGTKILARITELDGSIIAAERWPTGSADAAAEALAAFLTTSVPGGRSLGGVGIAAFGPINIDPASKAYGEMLATPKPGWTGSNLRFRLQERLAVPVAVDSDVNAAAVAEQRLGAGEGLVSVAYVTVGTGSVPASRRRGEAFTAPSIPNRAISGSFAKRMTGSRASALIIPIVPKVWLPALRCSGVSAGGRALRRRRRLRTC